MENRNWKDKIIIAFIIYVFSPLIIVALIVFGVPLIFENPKNRKEYKNSFYYKKTGVKYKRKIIYSPEYRFYNNAVKRKLPIEYIKQKSNGFEYFIYDGKIYMFPDFEQIEFNKEKNAFLVDYDGEWKSFDKAYEKMLSYLDNKNFEAKILVERKMFNKFKLSENDIPENIFVTREYETVFENEDFPLKLNIPENTFELYEMMKQTPNLCGEFEYSESKEIIIWKPYEKIEIQISVDPRDCCFELFSVISENKKHNITHWHPELYEVYEDVCRLGKQGNVLVCRSFFLGSGILYMGKKEYCPYSPDKKCILGRYYYLEAK